MAISKKKRSEVYAKYGGHCAYCGIEIEINDMQVDHFIPQYPWNRSDRIAWESKYGSVDAIENLMPSCRKCNNYKHSLMPEHFRREIMSLHERARKYPMNETARRYGIVTIVPWDGVFFYEKYKPSGREE